MHVLNEQLQFDLVVDWFTAKANMWPWTTKSVLSRTHTKPFFSQDISLDIS